MLSKNSLFQSQMANLELDPIFMRALALLRSKSKDSTDLLKGMLDDILGKPTAKVSLKTNIRVERVCSAETSGTVLTPKHSSPHCVAEWGVSGFHGQANGFEILNCRRGPRSPFACPLHPPHLLSAKHGKGTAFGNYRIVALLSILQTTITTNVRLFSRVELN